MLVGDMKSVPFADGHVLETVQQRGSHRRTGGPASRVHDGRRHCLEGSQKEAIVESMSRKLVSHDAQASRAGNWRGGLSESARRRSER
jgi:hypothetical protein